MRYVPLIVASLAPTGIGFTGAILVTRVPRWLRSWQLCPDINKFEIWRICRSWVVVGCFLVSLLSILFSGAFDVRELSSGAGASAFKSLLAENLLVASIVMGMHGIYLGVMLYHLIFRHPVEDEQWMGGIAFLLISLGYVSHAFQDYVHGGEGHETPSLVPITYFTPMLFAMAYTVMAAHSWHEARERQRLAKQSAKQDERPAQRKRETWMRYTDTVMVILMLWAFVVEMKKGGGEGRESPPESAARLQHIESFWEDAVADWFVSAYDRLSPKDLAILGALILYAVTRIPYKIARKSERPQLLESLLGHHQIDAEATNLSGLKEYLDGRCAGKSVWMDLKCGFGTQLKELIENLKLNPKTLSSMRIIMPLDGDGRANERAMAELRDYRPESRTHVTGLYSDAIVAMLQESDIIHIANAAYTPSTARAVLCLLSKAKPGTILLLRYTSGASYYRAVSASMSCAPIWPYIHHVAHQLLLQDLDKGNEWRELPIETMLITRHLVDIQGDSTQRDITNWVESQYGEFSADVVERYLNAFKRARVDKLYNSDWLHVREKR